MEIQDSYDLAFATYFIDEMLYDIPPLRHIRKDE